MARTTSPFTPSTATSRTRIGAQRPRHNYTTSVTASHYKGGRDCDTDVSIRRDCWNKGKYTASFYLPIRGKYSCGNGTSIKPMPGQARYWAGAR